MAVSPSPAMSGQSARASGVSGLLASLAQAKSRTDATPNRTAAIVNGGAASTATAPATHVPPKQIAIAGQGKVRDVSLRFAHGRQHAPPRAVGVMGRTS